MRADEAQELAELTRQVAELNRTVSQLVTACASSGSRTGQPQPRRYEAADIARRELCARRDRTKYLSADLVGEPAWDMLVDLYVHYLERKAISIGSACIASACPATTAMRYIDLLVEHNLVRRVPSATDRRTVYLELTNTALASLQAYFDHLRKSAEPSAFPQFDLRS